jgi:hypothetical protein
LPVDTECRLMIYASGAAERREVLAEFVEPMPNP